MLNPDPFPNRKYCKLQYSDNILITAPATNLSYEQIYSLNGLFDTDFTGTGHQPYGFDTMAVLYANYLCYACRVELEWYDPSADGLVCGYQLQGSTASGATISALDERPWSENTQISNTGDQRKVFRFFVPNHELLGVTKEQYRADTNNFGAAVTANPTANSYLRLFAVSTQAGATTTIKLNVKFHFYCTFFNRVTLAQSS